MHKKTMILIATLTTITFSACGTDKNKDTIPTETPIIEGTATSSADSTKTPVPKTSPARTFPTGIENPLDTAPELKFTKEENALYEKYIAEKNLDIFKDINQVSIAKVYIKSGINGNFEEEFKMYDPSTLDGMTLDRYVKALTENGIAGTPEIRQKTANLFFSSIDSNKFTDSADGTGYISLETADGRKIKINMSKSKEGIWLIDYTSPVTTE